MKNIQYLLFASVIIFSACSSNVRTSENEGTLRDSVQNTGAPVTEQLLTAKMTMTSVVNLTDSIPLRFTVYNNTDSARTFCKWHTPFEPLISKYLDVTDQTGKEIDYKGAMAKRLMPPPADSYITVNKGDSISVMMDLRKGYAIEKPGTYSIKYNSSGMSGLEVKDSISVTIK